MYGLSAREIINEGEAEWSGAVVGSGAKLTTTKTSTTRLCVVSAPLCVMCGDTRLSA